MSVANLIEEWRDVRGYEGFYQVSNLGRVKSLPRFVRHKTNRRMRVKGCMLMQRMTGPTGHQYRAVCLTVGQASKYVKVHRLVLEAFVGPCPAGMEARHFPDRSTANNRLDNLSWDTKIQNAADRTVHGTQVQGERVKVGKLTAAQVQCIRKMHATGQYSQEALAKAFGVKQPSISIIVRGKGWRHTL